MCGAARLGWRLFPTRSLTSASPSSSEKIFAASKTSSRQSSPLPIARVAPWWSNPLVSCQPSVSPIGSPPPSISRQSGSSPRAISISAAATCRGVAGEAGEEEAEERRADVAAAWWSSAVEATAAPGEEGST